MQNISTEYCRWSIVMDATESSKGSTDIFMVKPETIFFSKLKSWILILGDFFGGGGVDTYLV